MFLSMQYVHIVKKTYEKVSTILVVLLNALNAEPSIIRIVSGRVDVEIPLADFEKVESEFYYGV